MVVMRRKQPGLAVRAMIVGAALLAGLAGPADTRAQAPAATPPSLVTPDRVETRVGTLEFKDGAPSKATARQGLRQPALRARLRRLHEHLPGRQHGGDPQGLPEHRREGQRGHRLLRADGRQVAVPDGERRHGLFLRHPRPHQGAHGAGGAAQVARHPRRLLVALGHRLRRCPGPTAARAGNT